MEITVGELRALLANLPDDAIIETETEGDYMTFLQVVTAGGKRYDLDDLQPGDTLEAVDARREAKRSGKSEFARFLNGLVFQSGERPDAE